MLWAGLLQNAEEMTATRWNVSTGEERIVPNVGVKAQSSTAISVNWTYDPSETPPSSVTVNEFNMSKNLIASQGPLATYGSALFIGLMPNTTYNYEWCGSYLQDDGSYSTNCINTYSGTTLAHNPIPIPPPTPGPPTPTPTPPIPRPIPPTPPSAPATPPNFTNESVYGLNIAITLGDILCQMGPAASPDAPVRLVLGKGLYSPARGFRLIMQENQRLELQCVQIYNLPRVWPNKPLAVTDVSWVPIWRTGSAYLIQYLDMQYDGNLVAYNEYRDVIWASNTNGNNQAFLRLQDDGNLVITNQQGNVVWASNTSAGEATGSNAK
jgi:D-mannose binding lectin